MMNSFSSTFNRSKKMPFPQLIANNIGTQFSIRKDHNKNTTELVPKYKPIGLVDDLFMDP